MFVREKRLQIKHIQNKTPFIQITEIQRMKKNVYLWTPQFYYMSHIMRKT